MAQQANWYPDPYGRFQQRYHDGSAWTAHVISNGEQSVDPLGTTPSVPFAAPLETTVGTPLEVAPAVSSATAPRSFLDGLGPEARSRPAVDLSVALAGVSGVVLAAGIATAILGDSDTSRTREMVAAVVIVALAYVVRLRISGHRELRSAAVGAALVGIPGLAVGLTDAAGGGAGGGTLVLAAVSLIAAWMLPGLRGRPVLLGAGAIAIVLALTTVGGETSSDLFGFGVSDFIGGYSWLFVLVAVAFLAAVWWLDANAYHGIATSLVVAALLATALAVLKVVDNFGSTGAAFLVAVAGVVVAFVGDHGDRRASTWFGVGVASIGIVAAVVSTLTPTTAEETAASLVIAGVVLYAVAALVKSVSGGSAARP